MGFALVRFRGKILKSVYYIIIDSEIEYYGFIYIFLIIIFRHANDENYQTRFIIDNNNIYYIIFRPRRVVKNKHKIIIGLFDENII